MHKMECTSLKTNMTFFLFLKAVNPVFNLKVKHTVRIFQTTLTKV